MANQPFNFYQDTGFGYQPNAPTNYIDFFTGLYLPPDIPLGADVGFFWPLGDREITNTIAISGALTDSNKQITNLSVRFFGYFDPLVTESGKTYVKFVSGKITPCQIDNATYRLFFTGTQVSGNRDTPNYNLILKSGAVAQGDNDRMNSRYSFSGSVLSGYSEKVNYTVTFFGQFTTPDKDSAGIAVSMYNITYENGVSYLLEQERTGMFVQFRLSDILYANAH